MKRSVALLKLSREHHSALSLALHARRAANQGDEAISHMAAEITLRFQSELKPHFDEEERDLLPVLQEAGESTVVAQTVAEHIELARLVAMLNQPDAPSLLAFAELLNAHVRFEERQLFPLWQQCTESATKPKPATQTCPLNLPGFMETSTLERVDP